VLLPKFDTQQMVQRGKRRIGSRTARAMVTWSHYTFRQRLLDKAREHPWCKVVLVDEAFTSKTCVRCGAIHSGLGGSKLFRCPRCGVQYDRDEGASLGILLRFLST
jgi:putative transposase